MHVSSSRNLPVSFIGRRYCDFILQRSKLSLREMQLFILLFILWLALWVNILEYGFVGGLGFFLWLRTEVPMLNHEMEPQLTHPSLSLVVSVCCGQNPVWWLWRKTWFLLSFPILHQPAPSLPIWAGPNSCSSFMAHHWLANIMH